jgi:hypothetical protein
MTPPAGPDQLRTLSFGDVDGNVWGAGLAAGSAALIVGDRTGASVHVALPPDGWRAEGATWRLVGDGVELEVQPATDERESFPHREGGEPIRGIQELCRVRGAVSLSGAERRVDCPGTRSVIDGIEPAALESMRAVAGWFAPDEAFTLLALRAPGSRGQESDLVAATLFDPEGWVPVADPRLSTTYDGAGVPTRVNLELWVSEGDNELPRRAAGEAAAPSATATADGMEMRAIPLRCHSRGREGGGVYVLAGR